MHLNTLGQAPLYQATEKNTSYINKKIAFN